MNVQKVSLADVVATLGLVSVLTGGWAHAQESADCVLRIGTGPAGKVYEQMARDVGAVCGAAVKLCSVRSAGGLQNLDLMLANGAELGFVQVDVLRELANGDENIRALQVVMPLHTNLLHVLAADAGAKSASGWAGLLADRVVIRNFSELKGYTVAAVGAAQLLGQTLDRQLGYDMKFVAADNDEQALELLKEGRVQAVFTLGGWPLPTVSRLKAGQGVHLVHFNLEARPPYVNIKRNYQNLDAYNMNFLGVPNVLVTRPFKPGGSMAGKVAALQACLRNRLDELQEGRYHPAWKEIKDVEERYGFYGLTVPARTSSR